MAQPCKKNQKEVSAGKAFCADNFISSGPTCGSYCVECEETAAKGTVEKMIFDELHEIKPSDNCCSSTQFSVEEEFKMPLESVKAVLGHSNTEGDHQRKFNELVEEGARNEFVSQQNEDISHTHKEGAFSTSEAFNKLQDNSVGEKMINSHSKTEINQALSEMKEGNHTAFHNDNSDECSDIYTAGQTPPSQNNNCVAKNNKCWKPGSTCGIPENTSHLHPFSNNLNINTDIANSENINILPLMRNLSAENPSKGIIINQMQSKQPGKVCSRLTEESGNAAVDGNKTLNLNTESLCEPQAMDIKINKTEGESCIMVCNKENMLLTKREDLPSSMTTEEIIVMGSTKESCSCPIKNAEDLVNRSGKLSFDRPALDKKSEKISASLSVPRVNQHESQTACASTSKMPFLLKQKLFLQEIKYTGSRKISQNINVNAVVREETLGKYLNKSYF